MRETRGTHRLLRFENQDGGPGPPAHTIDSNKCATQWCRLCRIRSLAWWHHREAVRPGKFQGVGTMHSRVIGSKSKRWMWLSLVTCFVLLAFLASVVALYAVYLQYSASNLILSAKQLSPTSDTNKQIAIWRRQFQAKYSEETNANGNRVCEIRLNNGLLSLLRLVPKTQLIVSMEKRQEQLLAVFVVMSTEANGSASVWIQELFVGKTRSADPKQLYVDGRRDGSGRPWKTVVELTGALPAAEKERAFAIDTKCLVRFGGCRDASQIMPSVWR